MLKISTSQIKKLSNVRENYLVRRKRIARLSATGQMRYPQARWLSPQRANRAEPAITVRAYVSQVGVVAAKAIARANGMTASQEAAQGSAWRVGTDP